MTSKPMTPEQLAEIEARLEALPDDEFSSDEIQAVARFYRHAPDDIRDLLAEVRRIQQQAGNLLAVVFRDGGQYANSIGFEQACEVAAEEFIRLRGELERLSKELT